MDITVLIFLAGGIFLGWSLGANDAANVFGTAVGTRMVRFVTAATICSIFVVLGAVISGAGASHTLGKLGAINALAGSAVAAGSAAVTVFGMTRLGLPVSTSQAIVGAIIGWNLFSGFPTDPAALTKIVSTWVACPILAAIIAAALFKATTAFLSRVKWHLLRQDLYIRVGLILAGALGAFSLGANNIANVMGVFATANPFTSSDFGSGFEFSGIQKLFSCRRDRNFDRGVHLFQESDDDSRPGIASPNTGRRLGGSRRSLDRTAHVCISKSGASLSERRFADYSSRSGLELSGSHWRGHRYRAVERWARNPLACANRHCFRMDHNADTRQHHLLLLPLFHAECFRSASVPR